DVQNCFGQSSESENQMSEPDLPMDPPEEPPNHENNLLDQITLGDESENEEMNIGLNSTISDIETTSQFIDLLTKARLEDSNMHPDDISHLHEALSEFPFDAHDPDFLFALRTFLACNNASQETYNNIWAAALACHTDDPFLSYDQQTE
ncbi:hypothetical protein AX17_006075, partial [Amanita inopinata Kibby_2008]